MDAEKHDIAVIVGRFQVPYLHDGHYDLIRGTLQEYDRVLIVVGLSPLKATERNPLDYQARKLMLEQTFVEEFGDKLEIYYINDGPCDKQWSRNLDALIDQHVQTERHSVVLRGGDDSFIQHYHGKFDTMELAAERRTSGTALRAEVMRNSPKNEDFRRGVIWAIGQQYQTVYSTVDVVVFNEDFTKILVGKKAHENFWRFPGGFVSPSDISRGEAAQRELREETGLDVGEDTEPLVSAGSVRVDDWRYRKESSTIMTDVFVTSIREGRSSNAIPSDDLDELKWLDVKIPNTSPCSCPVINKINEIVDAWGFSEDQMLGANSPHYDIWNRAYTMLRFNSDELAVQLFENAGIIKVTTQIESV